MCNAASFSRARKIPHQVLLVSAFIFLTPLFCVNALAGNHDLPITLEIISPAPPPGNPHQPAQGNRAAHTSLDGSRNIEMTSGWPLTFKLTGPGDETIAVAAPNQADRPMFPNSVFGGYMVLDDPDGCAVLGELYREGLDDCAGTADPFGLDETWLEFTPDEDFPGVQDNHGHRPRSGAEAGVIEDMRATQENPVAAPEFGFGPNTGTSSDGIGWVRNDDLPQLVVLSDIGIGLSLTPAYVSGNPGLFVPIVLPTECLKFVAGVCVSDFDPNNWVPKIPRQARNLAGFMTSVAYELNNQNRKTTITTSVMVPKHLFWPNVLFDEETDVSPDVLDCVGERSQRVDGGPVVCGDLQSAFALDEDGRFEIRAFVLREYAPELWDDCNGDGIPNAADAGCNGYTLISNEVVIRVAQLPPANNWYCQEGADPWGTEFDGVANGSQMLVSFDGTLDEISGNCPGGGGGTNPPPR